MPPSRIPRADEQLVRKSDTVDGVAGRQAKDLAVRAVVAAYPAPNTAAAFDVYAGTTYSTSSAVVTNNKSSLRYRVVAKPVITGMSTATLWTYKSSAGHCKAAAFGLERASLAPFQVSSRI
jgi:hypothetical protein